MTGASLSDFFASWELFAPAVYSGVLAGVLLGLIGVYVVLRRVVFLTASISQAAGLGVAGAFFAQIHWGWPLWLASPSLGASFATLVLVGLLAFLWRQQGMQARVDGMLGYGFIVGMAGTLAIGTRIAQELHDIDNLLFGSAVAVMPEDLSRLLWIFVPVFIIHLWFWGGFVSTAFDRDGSAIRGVPVRLLDTLFFGTLAIAIAIATQVLGILPTFAFTVLPALATVRLAPNTHSALIAAAVVGGLCGFVGYVVAFLYQLPVGASQALVAAAAVLVAQIVYRLKVFWLRSQKAPVKTDGLSASV